MDASEQARVRRMQDNLTAIRKVASWSAQRLADEIGVTRQTISNLERKRTPLTKTQYIALRYVLNQEIAANGNQALAKVISALVDDPVGEPDEAGEGSAMGSLSATTAILAGGAAGAAAALAAGGGLLAPVSVAAAMSAGMGAGAMRAVLESSGKARGSKERAGKEQSEERG